ncbi:hypothetical protein G6O69_00585 [Pseudenhygromyxa sp. WMMC2535]|uniref:hypothetical protein n=1 Tax=Pseudenhygromyxa sp. WMMC2535 TaxID=2712867 RepID=UPI001555AF80|nr:hypothetical protein [Pseudenhygromyxa sp. WMMC2535]NVB36307.1 hypothetical protein [Pseudenhygromyxa sp. WMMC2535]
MAFEVGTDIEGMCSSCGDVWHVIVAKVGDKITKVQCKQCGKQHRLKPTGDAPEANLKPVKRKVAAPSGGAKRSSRARASTSTPGVVIDPNKPLRPYSMRERFEVGEQIDHSKFGKGVVYALAENKIRVNFDAGAKVLLHDKK